jgi:acetyl esterase/lipase
MGILSRSFVARALGAGLVTLFCATRAMADEPAPKVYEVELQENVQYGTGGGEPLTLHLAKPKGVTEPCPVILYIHGGGWRAGSKDGHRADISRAAAQGYVSASVGYRFAPAHRFPAQIEDVKCAVRYLRAHAKELNIDPNRIGAIGFSAGAHLSMILGAMDSADGLEGNGGWPEQSSKVQAVVAYFGPTNFNSPYPDLTVPIIEQFLGGTAKEKPEEYRLASPVTYVNKGDAPMLLFQGTVDVLVPYEQAFEMATALSKSGVPGRIELLLGKGHGWGNEDLEHTRQVGDDFFAQYLKKK